MKTKLKVYKKISLFFSITIHAIILVLLIEGNKKKLFPKTSMIEVELKSSYQNTKETPKSNYSVPLESIDRNMVSKSKKLSISNRTNKNLKNEIDKSQIDPYVKNLSKLPIPLLSRSKPACSKSVRSANFCSGKGVSNLFLAICWS